MRRVSDQNNILLPLSGCLKPSHWGYNPLGLKVSVDFLTFLLLKRARVSFLKAESCSSAHHHEIMVVISMLDNGGSAKRGNAVVSVDSPEV